MDDDHDHDFYFSLTVFGATMAYTTVVYIMGYGTHWIVTQLRERRHGQLDTALLRRASWDFDRAESPGAEQGSLCSHHVTLEAGIGPGYMHSPPPSHKHRPGGTRFVPPPAAPSPARAGLAEPRAPSLVAGSQGTQIGCMGASRAARVTLTRRSSSTRGSCMGAVMRSSRPPTWMRGPRSPRRFSRTCMHHSPSA